LKRHMRRADNREADRTHRARERVLAQIPGHENADGRSVPPTGHQPAAARTAAVSDRPLGASGCPTVRGNASASQPGGQSGAGRHRLAPTAEALPSSPRPRPQLTSPPRRPGRELA
jgi:hypothetical protein